MQNEVEAGRGSRKPLLTVLHGQQDIYSTTFQTRRLAAALAARFDVEVSSVPSAKSGWARAVHRIAANYAVPLLSPRETDYLLYCNDGAADLRHWRGSRIVYWYDAPRDWSIDPPKRREWIQWLRYRNIIEADWVFAVSAAQVRVARALRPGREDTVVYLPVGVDCSVFDPALGDAAAVHRLFSLPTKTIVGYLGYLGIYDGRFAGEILLDAAPGILKSCDAHFLIVGFGPAFEVWKTRVAALGLAAHFTFTGFVEDALLPSCIAAMDLCIDTLEPGFHSEARSETKLKQYMAMGRACVATAIGENCVDLANGRCGVLVPPGHVALAEGVRELVGDSARRAELGAAVRARALAVYDWRVLAGKMADVVLDRSESARRG